MLQDDETGYLTQTKSAKSCADIFAAARRFPGSQNEPIHEGGYQIWNQHGWSDVAVFYAFLPKRNGLTQAY